MTLDVLLALGLLLSAASQLRPAGAPAGPGEMCLVIWLLAMLCRETGRLGPPLTSPLSILVIFWLMFALALGLGTMAAFAIGDVHDSSLFLHDAIAYPLLAAVSCLSVVEPGAARRLHSVAWLLVTLGSAFLALQMANAWELFDVPDTDPWYWDRLRGWSENPNQLALLCLVLALLALHLADTATRIGGGIAAMACATIAVYVGRLTQSDTFSFVLLAAGPVFVALKLRSWLFSFERALTLRSAFAWMVIFALPFVLAAAVLVGYAIRDSVEDIAMQMAKNNGKETGEEASLRFQSWGEAISRGFESGMLGLGPGPHLEIPPTFVEARQIESEPKYIEHPEVNNTPNFEAHNTILDLFTQGGVVAVLSFVWLLATSLIMTYRARLDGSTTLLCGLALFSICHLIVRHPLFWFAIAFCLVTSTEIRKRSATRKWS